MAGTHVHSENTESAKLLATDQASISRIEADQRNITLKTLAKLARVLGLKVTVDPSKKQ